ncbi:MAG: ABC transporter ATP-binding protein [Phototrophicaceae bacterium]
MSQTKTDKKQAELNDKYISNTTSNYTTEDEKVEIESISDSFLMKMLWRFLKPYLWELISVTVLLFAVAGMQLLLPYLVKMAIDGPIASENLAGIFPIGVGYLLTVLAIFILQFGYTYWLQTIGQKALLNLRQELFEHIVKQDIKYFNNTPVGRIVSRMSNDIEALTELLSTSIVMVARNMIMLVGIVGVMLALNWRLALISLAVIPVMAALSAYFRTKLRGISSRFHKIMAAYQAYLNEQFNGMMVIQLFNREKKTRDDFEVINQDYFDSHMDLRDIYTYYGSTLQIMTTVGLALVLWGGGQGVLAGWQGVTIGILVAFIEYVRMSFEPILQLSEQFAQIQTAFSAGERIARMLDVEPEVGEPENAVHVKDFKQSVVFKDVSFAYREGYPILKNINLEIQSGQRIAVVGATGAGKTTLVKLLARYYDVDSGSIEVSGVDLRELSLQDLRRFVSLVPQDPYCFNGTIGDNLRLFDESITLEQMEEASEIACAKPFIDKMPNRFDFKLLPGGRNLSQGQRQLLALARALVHSPESILILDEATSSIDTETEAYIQEGLEQILANRTSLIIAHRLSTVRDADRILVMQEGEIIEDGSHDELLELGGMYATLYYRQYTDPNASIDDLLSQKSSTIPAPKAG